jgi:hypothetical protein
LLSYIFGGMEIATKSQFATLVGVSAARVSQWIAARKICGDALVGEGRHARIRVEVARDQLRRNLSLGQRLGANGKARLGGPGAHAIEPAAGVVDAPQAEGISGFSGAPVPDRIEDEIKRARRDQLVLANDRAREHAAARAGRYLIAEDSRQQMGRMAAAMVATFEGALPEFAMALAAKSNLSNRDALHVLREAWRTIRGRASEADAKAAAALPALIEDAPPP